MIKHLRDRYRQRRVECAVSQARARVASGRAGIFDELLVLAADLSPEEWARVGRAMEAAAITAEEAVRALARGLKLVVGASRPERAEE